MKRLFALLVACILLISCSVAYAADYSSMTDAELKQQMNAIRNVLVSRGLRAENKTVILDQNGVEVYINGTPKVEETWLGMYLIIPIVIINNSGKNIYVLMDNTSVNGWTADGSVSSGSVPEGKKAKAELRFELEDTDVETILDFEEVEFVFMAYNDDDWFGTDVIPKTAPITIYSSQIQ